jgi:phage major head subunit gpT-like protein
MSLDTSRAVATLRSLTHKFDAGVQMAAPVYPQLCTIVPSDGADEEYGMLGRMPGIREWVGDRNFKSLRAAKFTIANRKWESSVAIEKDDIDDDRMGLYGPILEGLGQEAAHHPDELTLEVLVNGESEACFDGQTFFDTDHLWGDSGSQSNDLTYNASDHTAVTEDEFRDAYHAARTAMLNFKSDQGKSFIRPTIRPLPNLLLLVPTALEKVANMAINKQLVDAGETNIVLDKPRIMTLPTSYLSSGVKFYLLNLGQSLKPFVFQARKPLSRQMKGLDDHEFKDVKFMCDARYNVGYLAWWNAVLTTFN